MGKILLQGVIVAVGYLGVRKIFRALAPVGGAVLRPRDEDGYPIHEGRPSNAHRR